jgi:hypothetical protein
VNVTGLRKRNRGKGIYYHLGFRQKDSTLVESYIVESIGSFVVFCRMIIYKHSFNGRLIPNFFDADFILHETTPPFNR